MGKILDYVNFFASQFSKSEQVTEKLTIEKPQNNTNSDEITKNITEIKKCESCRYVSILTTGLGAVLVVFITKKNIHKYQGGTRYLYFLQGYLTTLALTGLAGLQIVREGPFKNGESLYELILKNIELLKSSKLTLKKE